MPLLPPPLPMGTRRLRLLLQPCRTLALEMAQPVLLLKQAGMLLMTFQPRKSGSRFLVPLLKLMPARLLLQLLQTYKAGLTTSQTLLK